MIWALLIVGLVAGISIFRSDRLQEYLAVQGFMGKSLKADEREALEKHFDFFRKLLPKSKRIFAYRVARFKNLTEFIPHEMRQVTNEMEVLISASAVQLTFGFDHVLLDHFTKIIVYPDKFFSTSAQRYHKGEVNPCFGIIALSWKHFVEGYAFDEGVNVGLHEMAHALQLENVIVNSEYGFMTNDDVAHWQRLATKEIEKIISPEQSFFRSYGGVDQAEFFAVAVENFFERPKAFHDYHQQLYRAMCRLLKQDPLLLER